MFRWSLIVSLCVNIWAFTWAQDRLTFVGVALDLETRQADRKLQDFLRRKANVAFAPEELEYGRVIDRLANWNAAEGPYLARTTPYVYVIAEMLGADFDILATYVSAATQKTTYRSYFVVNRSLFPDSPSLSDLVEFLATTDRPARFVFHSKLSTSSFFLPCLYFRSNKIFSMDEKTESLVAIRSQQIEQNSSTALVKMVAGGRADLAAVWDGTKTKFHQDHPSDLYETYGSKVYFIPLPTSIPNDLLVCSRSLEPDTKRRLQDAIESMADTEIEEGDFLTWFPIKEATAARAALADLRWLAREQVAPVTVEVVFQRKSSTGGALLLEAVQQALRFSGTEFIAFDEDYHEHIDFLWTLEEIHDGAMLLKSSIPGSGIPDQVFHLSFRDVEDLTARIVDIIRSRLHRIRYIWPYSMGPPIVIRDLAASYAAGSEVRVQKIWWLDPERNSFRAGRLFDARISASGFHKYELDPNDFPQFADRDLDPLGHVSYRVFLVRSERESLFFRILTGTLLGLLLLAGLSAVWDVVRHIRSKATSSSAETRTTL